MPELPEVHTIANDIKKALTGFVVVDIWHDPLYKKLEEPSSFKKNVIGSEIITVERIAKNIIVKLSDEKNILIHLAMTGRVRITEKEDESIKWVKLIIKFSSENKVTKSLYFSDVRMFGKVKLINNTDLEKLKNRYGPEPINSVDLETFKQTLKKLRRNIKTVLLDQTIISGLGNIYATDTLFLAGVNPEKPANTLTTKEVEAILNSANKVLNEGIQHRGSTLEDRMYVDAFGKEGKHQNFFYIYGKKVCPKCKGKVEYKKIGGRGTYFCPNCQRL